MISSWVTDAAPCRCAVPRQSAPVSPPPMITTCRPRALIAGSGDPPTARLASGRYSMAWWMPARSRPGSGRSRGTRAPPHSTTASNPARSSAAVTSVPASTPERNRVPSARIWASRRSRCRFSSLNWGMPNRSRPPGASSRSKTVTACPALVSCWAAASPAGPEPITVTVRPDRTTGGLGTTHPAANAWSMISTSTCLIVTGSALIPSTQAASHGAGQSRPVNSGKLFVACSRSAASRQSSRKTRSFHSGIRFPSGQPLWQNGIPQFMHRDACSRRLSCEYGSYTSCQSRTRTGIGRRVGVSRRCLRKPVTSPMRGLHHQLVGVEPLLLRPADGGDDPLEVLREDLQPPLALPVVEHPRRDRRPSEREVLAHHGTQPRPVLVGERVDVDHLGIDARGGGPVRVADERQPARHAGGEVAASEAED